MKIRECRSKKGKAFSAELPLEQTKQISKMAGTEKYLEESTVSY